MKKPPPVSRHQIVQAYQHHVRQVVGLSPKTWSNHSHALRQFLESTSVERSTQLAKLTPNRLTDYLAGRSKEYQPASLRQIAGVLRQFLRFAQQQGWIIKPLSLAVPAIAGRNHELAAYLSQPQLQLLLKSWDRRTAQGRRNVAIGLCLARLGLRSSEVAALRLEDVDWRQGILRVTDSKNARTTQLPLPNEVGRSMAAYLRAGRPPCSHRQVFVLHQPVRPMNGQAISRVIACALRLCGIHMPRPGAHLLRHTLASHLVQNGASLKEVADLLRHRHLSSTGVYAHLDIAHLRLATQSWPKEVTL